jgi:hypothetical protein
MVQMLIQASGPRRAALWSQRRPKPLPLQGEGGDGDGFERVDNPIPSPTLPLKGRGFPNPTHTFAPTLPSNPLPVGRASGPRRAAVWSRARPKPLPLQGEGWGWVSMQQPPHPQPHCHSRERGNPGCAQHHAPPSMRFNHSLLVKGRFGEGMGFVAHCKEASSIVIPAQAEIHMAGSNMTPKRSLATTPSPSRGGLGRGWGDLHVKTHPHPGLPPSRLACASERTGGEQCSPKPPSIALEGEGPDTAPRPPRANLLWSQSICTHL